MKFQVVPIAQDHIRGFHAAVDSVARKKLYLAMLEAPPLDESAKFVRENIGKGNAQFVALAGERVVGWCDVVPVPRAAMAHSGILGMGVVEGHRGAGIGSALLRATLAKARANGLTRVELTVREDNLRARALYERFGFAAEGLKRNGFRVDGVYFNLVLMALLFERSTAS